MLLLIPFLVKVNFPKQKNKTLPESVLKKISIRPFLGPKVGIPIRKMKLDYNDSDYDDNNKMKGATIGMDFGCGIAIPLGKFVLGADVRYGIDFNKVKAQFE